MNTEKLKNLYTACPDKYGAAQEMGTTYQSLYNIIYKGSVCKVDLLQRIANYFKVPVGYFFDEEHQLPLYNEHGELERLREENRRLKEKLTRMSDPKLIEKENKIYNLWMKFMEITEEMQVLYKEKGE